MADAGLEYLDPCFTQPVLHFGLQNVANFVCATPQCDGFTLMVVVGVAGGHVPNRRLALNRHVVLLVIDFKHRLCGIDDAPDHDRSNLDRVAR